MLYVQVRNHSYEPWLTVLATKGQAEAQTLFQDLKEVMIYRMVRLLTLPSQSQAGAA
jgi:hypothetical protein